MTISKGTAKLYIMIGQVAAYMLVTLFYYSMLKHFAQNDYYMSAILSATTGAIWGAGITNMLNTLRDIRKILSKDFALETCQITIRRYRNFACISVILLFFYVGIIVIFNL